MEFEQSSETKEEYIVYKADRRLIGLLPMFILVLIIVLRISWTLYKSFGQKTRNPQQRRMYVGSRARPSLGQAEPSIYVSPSNLPPPPKYECMAPPSYEEVVGVHYPNYQVQPITQPISTALAQNAPAQSSIQNETRSNEPNNETVTQNNDNVASNNETIVVRNNAETIVTVTRPITASS